MYSNSMNPLDELLTDHDKAQALLAVLIARATGESTQDRDYQVLRSHFIQSPYDHFLPTWIRPHRTLAQFWPFIQAKFGSYRERRAFLYKEFDQLLDATANNAPTPVEKSLNELLVLPSHDSLMAYWHKCIERSHSDPEGAVTAARTLLESVLKYIASDLGIPMDKKNPDLPELYSAVAKHLSLSPRNHKERLIKQILSGCNSVVGGIAELRNLYGDAHGKGREPVRLEPRHAHLAVNLAGTMASFLIATTERTKQRT